MDSLFFLSGKEALNLKFQKINFFSLKKVVFGDGEISIVPEVLVSGKRVVLLHFLYEKVNDSLVSLLLSIRSFKECGASEIIVILPYLFYSRQDKDVSGGTKLILNLLACAGASEIVTLDMHSEKIINFSSIPIKHLSVIEFISDFFKNKNFALVSPDLGGVNRVIRMQNKIGGELVSLNKIRKNFDCEVSLMSGNIQNKKCLIVDDILDGGSTILAAAKFLKESGVESVSVFVVHALFSGKSIERIKKSQMIDGIYITDTIPHSSISEDFIHVFSIVPLLEEVCLSYI